MKKIFLIIVITFSSNLFCFAQSYSERYNSFYERYEYYDSNGNLIGYKKWNSLYNRFDIEFKGNNSNNSYNNNVNKIQPYNIELINKVLESKQNRYDSNIERMNYKVSQLQEIGKFFNDNMKEPEILDREQEINNLIKEYAEISKKINNLHLDYSVTANANYVISQFDYFINEFTRIIKEIQDERNATIDRMNQIVTFYNSITSYPKIVKDGWHIVQSLNNKDFCEERKVYVQNNVVTKYIVDDWESRNIQYSTSITNGKTTIKLVNSDEFLDLYFLDYILTPTKTVTEPQTPGKISFWKNFGGDGYIKVWVEGKFIGEIDSYFDSSVPSCSQDGTLTFENKPGTYNYKAENNKHKWSGTFTISSNDCKNIKFSVK